MKRQTWAFLLSCLFLCLALIAAVWVLEHSLDAGEIMALATPPVQ